MMDTKNFLASKTFQGLIVMILTLALPKLGLKLGDDDTQQLAVLIIQALAALWIAVGRIAASKGVSLGIGQTGQQGDTPSSQSGHVRFGLLAGICCVCIGFGLALQGGCAMQRIASMTGPEQARTAAYELLTTWNDTYTAYAAALPQMTVEQQQQAAQTVAPAINKAKPAVLALAAAADAWSVSQQGNATGAEECAALATDAQALISNALDLLQQAKR